jgi:hypothetical protein
LEQSYGEAEKTTRFVGHHGEVLGFGWAGCGVAPLDVLALTSVEV